MRSYNYKRFKEIATNAGVYDHISDDFSPSIDEYEPLEMDELHYLEWEGGFFMFVPENGITCEVHTIVLPDFQGRTLKPAKRAAKWIFGNTEYRKINTQVPVYNRKALALTIRVGFKKEGLNKMSFMKNGIIYDQWRYGLCQ